MDDVARSQLDRTVQLLREVLGDNAVGAYLHGSAVLGGLRPHSDLDILAVCHRTTTRETRRQLVEGLLAISSGWPAAAPLRPIELTLVASVEIRPWRFPPSIELQFGEWYRKDLENGLEPWDRVYPDLAPLIAMALQGNHPLFGPPPADVFEPVPHADLVRAIADDLGILIPGLHEDETRFAVLTFARIWMTVTTGEFATKDEAAAWALSRLPPEHRPVLERARAIYLGHEEDRWDDLRARLQPYADHLIAAITRMTESERRSDARSGVGER